MRPILIHLRPLRVSDGTRVDIRVGDAPLADAYGLGGFEWEPAISRRPTFTSELMAADMSGRVQTGKASFALQLRQIHAIPDPHLLYWGGAPVVIYSAPDYGWQSKLLEFDGLIATNRPDADSLVFAFEAETSAALIEKPVLTGEFTGGGGILGEPETRGVLWPAGFGVCENIEPSWFNTVDNIGMIDGYGNCLSIDRLMEGANDLGPRVADYPTYAALQSAIATKAVAKGQWGTCVAQGLVGLGAPPAGVIGVNAVFGGGKPGSIMRRLIEVHAAVPVASVDTASFDDLTLQIETLVGGPANVHWWTKEQRDVKSILEAVAGSCNATPLITLQGKIAVTRAVLGPAAATLDRSGSIEPRVLNWRYADTEPPVYELRARVARPANVLARDQVFFSDTIIPMGIFNAQTVYRAGNTVFKADGSEWLYINLAAGAGHALPATAYPPAPMAANAWWQQLQPGATYADGTSIEAWKPAAPGATKNRIFSQSTDPALVPENNVVNGDTWNDTSATPIVKKDRVAGAWVSAANLVLKGPDIGVAAGATAGRNRILNPGGESGAAAPWMIDQPLINAFGAGTGQTITANATGPIEGKYSLLITKAAAGHTAPFNHPAIPVKPGGKYIVRGSFRGSSATVIGLNFEVREKATLPASGYVTWADQTSVTALINNGPVSASNTEFTFTYTVPAGVYFVSLSVGSWVNAPVELRFDSIEFYDFTDNELGADVTKNHQVSIVIPTIPVITANYQGVLDAGQFPKVITPAITRGGVSIRTDAAVVYSLSNITPGLTGAASVNNVAGSADKGRITITNAMTATGSFDLNVTVSGVAQAPIRVLVEVKRADPPSGTTGTGGGAGNKYGEDSAFPSVTSTTYTQISDIITVDKATGETIRAYAPLDYDYTNVSTNTRHLLLKWRYAPTGTATYTDMGSPVSGSSSTWEDFNSTPASIVCNQTAAPANGVYDVTLWAAISGPGGTINITGGTASVQVGV